MKKGLKRVLPAFAFIVLTALILGAGWYGYNTMFGPKAPSPYLQLTKDNIEKEVSAKGLVYFYACFEDRYACQVQREQFEKFASAYGDQVKVAYLNVAEQPELAASLGIQSAMDLPAHFVIRDGKLIGAAAGVFSAEELAGLITQMLQQPAQGAPVDGGAAPAATPAAPAGN